MGWGERGRLWGWTEGLGWEGDSGDRQEWGGRGREWGWTEGMGWEGESEDKTVGGVGWERGQRR